MRVAAGGGAADGGAADEGGLLQVCLIIHQEEKALHSIVFLDKPIFPFTIIGSGGIL